MRTTLIVLAVLVVVIIGAAMWAIGINNTLDTLSGARTGRARAAGF